MATKTIQTPLSYDACRVCDLEIGDEFRDYDSTVSVRVSELDIDHFICYTVRSDNNRNRIANLKTYPRRSQQLVYLIKNARK